MAVGVYLYRTDVVVDNTGTTEPLRIAVGGTYNHPTADGIYPGIGLAGDVALGLLTRQTIYPDRLGFGFGSIDSGVLQCVAPSDGEYDYLTDVGFGKPATIRYGFIDEPISNFKTVFSGVASNAEVSSDVFRIGWQDATKLLDNPISEGKFAGTNSGTSGYEGLATDIKGQRKPRAFGRLPDIEPILVNAPLRVYAWNYSRTGSPGASSAVNDIRVRGFPWTNVGDYADAAALAALSLTTGQFATCLAESKIRMGGSSSIDGSIRMDVTVSTQRIPQIIQSILTDAGIPSGSISSADITDLQLNRNFVGGVYLQDETTRDAIDQLLKSILAWCYVDYTGSYRFGVIPTTVDDSIDYSIRKLGVGSVGDINTFDWVSIEPEVDSASKNVPAKSVRVGYFYRREPPSKDSLASGLTDDVKQSLSQEFRYTSTSTNSATALLFDNSDELEWLTVLVNESDANFIRNELLSIVGTRQHRYAVDIFAEPDNIDKLRLGGRVNLYATRFGLQNGKQMLITSLQLDVKTGFISLSLLEIGSV